MTIKVAFIMDTTVCNIKKRWADAVQQAKVVLYSMVSDMEAVYIILIILKNKLRLV